ncbi:MULTISPECIES: hypothetical protein [unclassified Streptomyces]|uniref:TolB family protein n=1 Tax=unclassified Streptomyces TaxID=2593676 RepID=UPI002250831A|nr:MULTISPECIES: hypothetical protein [unclassified Streptomyces]MCX5061606.1 hypothetical protein [Streptomyces sp. NBC_00452]MCX5292780.1 hypothetical protein [Streptomyces sp. NBC_00183]
MHRNRQRAALTAAVLAVALGGVAALPAAAAPAPEPRTERVTVAATGEQGTDNAGGPYLSADGRYAAFASYAPDLVPGDTNGVQDSFVRDLRTGRVERVSVTSDGVQADSGTSPVAISANGQYVVLVSTADNLTDWPAPKEYWAQDVYVHDRVTGRTQRVSTTPDGGSSYAHGDAAISDDGRYVAFNARPSRMETSRPDIVLPAVYVTDRRTGEVERITNGDHPDLASYFLDMDATGRHVAYVQNGPRGAPGPLMVHDRRTGTEEAANVTPEGRPGERYGLDPSLSADGRLVSFTYTGDDLVPGGAANTDIYVRDLRTDTTRAVVHAGPGEAGIFYGSVISRNGRYVAYSFRTPQGPDNVYVRDLRTGTSTLASESTTGAPVTDGDVYVTSFGGDRLLGLGSGSGQLVPGDTNGVTDGFVRHLR